MTFTVGSLFAGIGGLDLGFERAGFVVRWQIEIDEFCCRVLERHWPDVPRYRDVRECFGPFELADADRETGGRLLPDAALPADSGAEALPTAPPEPRRRSHLLQPVDVLIGGFPCQPHSCAGKRLGRDDPRHLWPEYARLVRELRPSWICAENVPGLRHTAADDVLGDLDAAGYAAWPLVVGASDVGAPHRRKRVFIVARLADGDCGGCGERRVAEPAWVEGAPGDQSSGHGDVREQHHPKARPEWLGDIETELYRAAVADTKHGQRDKRQGPEPPPDERAAEGRAELRPDGRRPQRLADAAGARRQELRRGESGAPATAAALQEGVTRWPARPGEPQHDWEPSRVLRRAESGVGFDAHGLPPGLVRHRRRALAALGNAVVPQVAQVVAEAIRGAL